jgi:hypothetical protein
LDVVHEVLLLSVDPICQYHQDESSDSYRGTLSECLSLHSQKQSNPRLHLMLRIRRLRRIQISGHYRAREKRRLMAIEP